MRMLRYLQMRGDYPPGRGLAMRTFNTPLLYCCSSKGGERRMWLKNLLGGLRGKHENKSTQATNQQQHQPLQST